MIKDSVIYLFGDIFSKIIPFLLLPYLTRKLGVADYGELAFILSLISLCVVVGNLGLDNSIPRYCYKYGKQGLLILKTCGFLIAISIFSTVCFFGLVLRNEMVLLVSFCAFSQMIFGLELVVRQSAKKSKEYVSLQVVSNLLSVTLTILLFEFIGANFEYRIESLALANILMFSFCNLRFFDDVKKISLARIKIFCSYILNFGWPFVFHGLALYSKGQVDRIIIYKFLSAHELGIYSAGYQLASLIMVLLMAINKGLLPFYFERLKDGRIVSRQVLSASLFLLLLPFVTSFIVYFVPNSLYLLILGESFQGVKLIIMFFAFGFSLNASYFTLLNYLIFLGESKKIAKLNLLSAAFHVGCLILLTMFAVNFNYYALVMSASNFILILMMMYSVKKVG